MYKFEIAINRLIGDALNIKVDREWKVFIKRLPKEFIVAEQITANQIDMRDCDWQDVGDSIAQCEFKHSNNQLFKSKNNGFLYLQYLSSKWCKIEIVKL